MSRSPAGERLWEPAGARTDGVTASSLEELIDTRNAMTCTLLGTGG